MQPRTNYITTEPLSSAQMRAAFDRIARILGDSPFEAEAHIMTMLALAGFDMSLIPEDFHLRLVDVLAAQGALRS